MFGGLNLFGRAHHERSEQVRELQRSVPSARIGAEDASVIDVTYEGTNHAEDDRELKRMRIFLPPRFPVDKPVLQLMQKTTHPCVDQYNQVSNLASLDEWSPRSSLAALVTEVLALLTAGSPTTTERSSSRGANDEARADPLPRTEKAKDTRWRFVERPASQYVTPSPEIPGSFHAVEAMSETDAELLLADEDVALHDFLEQHVGAVKSMRELRDSLRASNAKAARELLQDVRDFEAAREDVLKSRQDAVEAIQKHDALLERARGVAPDDPNALDALASKNASEAADAADAESEKLNDDFRDGTLDLSSWHKAYLATRVRYHTHAGLAHAHQARLRSTTRRRDRRQHGLPRSSPSPQVDTRNTR